MKRHNNGSGNEPFDVKMKGIKGCTLTEEQYVRIADRGDRSSCNFTPYLRSSISELPQTAGETQSPLAEGEDEELCSSETKKHSSKDRKNFRRQHGTGSRVAKLRIGLEEKFQANLENSNHVNTKRVELMRQEQTRKGRI